MHESNVANVIFKNVLAGQYADGWGRYEVTPDPTAEDRRWAALCLMHAGRVMDAKRLLAQAIAEGCEAARIELATLHRTLGDTTLAGTILGELNTQTLASLDQALALREAGIQALQRSALLEATSALEQAWVAASATAYGPSVAAPIAHALGMVCAERGLDQRASTYFAFAAAHAHPTRLVYVHASQALTLVYLGQDSAAQQLFRQAADYLGSQTSPVALTLQYSEALHARAWRHYARAAERFTAVSRLARTYHHTETECYAELWLCALATLSGDVVVARRHLARAHHLSTSHKTRILVALRTGALRARTGEDGLGQLHEAVKMCADLGLRREEGWVWLHLGEAFLRAGASVEAKQALEHAADARYAIDSPAIAIELDQVPLVRQHLHEGHNPYAAVLLDDARLFASEARSVLKLETLGNARLTLNDKPLRLDMARSPELLAYLLTSAPVRLEKIQLDLFTDTPHKRSKSYIHQVRAALQCIVPGLRIPYNALDKTYDVQLTHGLTLTWDLEQVMAALRHPDPEQVLAGLRLYRGPFLPKSEGEWTNAKREELLSTVVSAGRDLLDQWGTRGEAQQALRLAQLLHDLDPADEHVSEALIHATLSVSGANAALRTWRTLCARFQAQVGEVPPGLEAMKHLLGAPSTSYPAHV